ncbi:hypothetical protein [Paenibacillus silvae]|uniref:hypothetical protein n=1 Tax=Paenibacillus silvae TaxID=1325358 RepID=UPI00200648A5|nr:hypothetical protein [Paenibacillus silvae]MCK6074102.1 hypothetical protein [Paenibacillus silvae]MCK6148420.1 hypothetical protein [Paenibacillus silvae]MCK6266720.1 hypothetical protein [Paenibacillus silvae]
MILGKTTDTSGLSKVAELSDELQPVFERAAENYALCDIELYFVFRCLPDEYGRKSSVRHVKAERVIYFDLTVSEDRYKNWSESKQRHALSHTFYTFLGEKMKYKIEHLDTEEFTSDMGIWLKEIGWLQTEEDAELGEKYGL